jgi:hypothetical protein
MVQHSKKFKPMLGNPQLPIKVDDFTTSCLHLNWTPFPLELDTILVDAQHPIPCKFNPAAPVITSSLTSLSSTCKTPDKLHYSLPVPLHATTNSALIKFTVYSPSTTSYKPILATVSASPSTLLTDFIAAIPCKRGKFGTFQCSTACFLFFSGVFYTFGDIAIPLPNGCISKPMNGVKFKDLDLAIGVYYLYSHSGCCEHGIIFKI